MTHDRRAAESGSPLEIMQFLAGRTTASGVFRDRFGRVRRSFKVLTTGWWDGTDFVLDEAFVFDDGEQETRQWRMFKGVSGSFTATCVDCLGGAVGETDAHGWRMRYRFRLRFKDRSLVVKLDDRMIRIDEHRALNTAKVSKWGVSIGEILIVFERQTGP
jgi:hypothetical protein